MAVTSAQINQINKAGVLAAQAKPKSDKDLFMKLFVAQLKNQDPLNPMSNKDATAQMAQFTQLEQLTNMNKTLEGLAKMFKVNQTVDAAALIGKSVLASGTSLSKKGDSVSKMVLDIPKNIKSVKVNIHDASGNIVRTVDIKNPKTGKLDFTWDGKLANGDKAPDGVYKISLFGQNKDGKKFMIPTQIEGVVKAVEVKGGQQVLQLADGRSVLLSNVWKIIAQNTQ